LWEYELLDETHDLEIKTMPGCMAHQGLTGYRFKEQRVDDSLDLVDSSSESKLSCIIQI
jgi:hypothetical protein